ncbi:hypothetical protein DFH06DRAFT_1140875 [Mycena polygramma]|nr:hypothetical protein DFH06DRAFT_1140875 [Mycena polygramma]
MEIPKPLSSSEASESASSVLLAYVSSVLLLHSDPSEYWLVNKNSRMVGNSLRYEVSVTTLGPTIRTTSSLQPDLDINLLSESTGPGARKPSVISRLRSAGVTSRPSREKFIIDRPDRSKTKKDFKHGRGISRWSLVRP